MTKYNKNFELSIEDLERIEDALRDAETRMAQLDQDPAKAREIHELLGRLHNQKNFFRPKVATYVSG